MAKKDNPEQVKLSQEEVENIQKCIKESNLPDNVKDIVLGLIDLNIWLHEQIATAKLTIKKLKKFFGFKNESRNTGNNTSNNEASDDDNEGDNEGDNQQDNCNKNESSGKDKKNNNEDPLNPKWDPNNNHGRYSANDYTGCPIHNIPFDDPDLQKGLCPECAKNNTVAKITPITPKILVFLEGHPIVSGNRYYLERARCVVCHTYFTAPLPGELENRPKYSPSCVTSLAIHHYYGGMPFKRIETLQQLQGVPFADATQFDYINRFYTESVAPVVEVLMTYAANGDSLFFDN